MDSQSTLHLDIAIIGAGISGLATALTISNLNQGYRIRIFEAAPSLSDIGAGIQLNANATRVLFHLGLEDEFRKIAHEPKSLICRRYDDDRILGEFPNNPLSTWIHGFPHLMVYRPDLQRILAEACKTQSDIEILFNKSVKAVDTASATVEFEDGERITTDLVIGADGVRSRTRDCMVENKGIAPEASTKSCFRTVVPQEKMMEHSETAELITSGSWTIFAGPGLYIVCYTISGGAAYNVILIARDDNAGSGEEAAAKWSQPGDIQEVRRLIEPFCSRMKTLWSLVDSCIKWTICALPDIPTYHSGKCVLVGDAAHAINPDIAQGGAMALEDAATLAEFIKSVRNESHLSTALEAWSGFRQERLANIRRMANSNREAMTLPDGKEQQERDQAFAVITEVWKKELSVGEEEFKKKPKPVADPNAEAARSQGARMYMDGYNSFEEAKRAIQEHGIPI